MLFSVPQYIDVEDKIAGPLTAKQFLWMLGMGAILIVLWNIFEQGVFFVIAVPVCLTFAALAFYKPQGVHLVTFIGYGLSFLLQPKIYVWRRMTDKENKRGKKKKEFKSQFYKKSSSVNAQDISALASALDSEGYKQTDRLREIFEAEDVKRQKTKKGAYKAKK